MLNCLEQNIRKIVEKKVEAEAGRDGLNLPSIYNSREGRRG
jgi:hypothetical protein